MVKKEKGKEESLKKTHEKGIEGETGEGWNGQERARE